MSEHENKKRLVISATTFRNILFGLFALLFALAVALAILGTSTLQETADDVRAVIVEADTIEQTNTRTTVLWNQMQENQKVADRAKQVVADSKSYAYQDVIIRDLKSFARKAGITITNYDFTVEGAGVVQQIAPAVDASSEPIPSLDPDGQPSSGSSLKTTSVSVTVANPVNYSRLLTFIHYVEQNLTKMQISKVALSRAGADDPKAVSSDSLIIEVYIR